jgi:hypothetical protein
VWAAFGVMGECKKVTPMNCLSAIYWLANWPTVWLNDSWLNYCLNHWLLYWLTHPLTHSLTHWFTVSLTDSLPAVIYRCSSGRGVWPMQYLFRQTARTCHECQLLGSLPRGGLCSNSWYDFPGKVHCRCQARYLLAYLY